MTVHLIRFCPACGQSVAYRLPDDADTHERAICTACHTVHYQNPLNVVGTIPTFEGRILLCRRNIEPRHGFWTLPAGFMELGESLEEGACRETREEAGAQFELGPLFSLITVEPVTQVHIYFRAQLTSLTFDPGPETQAVELFAPTEIPWDQLAFRNVHETLRLFCENPEPVAPHVVCLGSSAKLA
jgi:ADP-ribose pyrophosphatase YjhB (NUDIX family)